jgi:glycosyltransferase EpsF
MRQHVPRRILHIVSAMDRGGAETLIMNVYRNVDKSQVQFDFIVHRSEKGDYDNLGNGWEDISNSKFGTARSYTLY